MQKENVNSELFAFYSLNKIKNTMEKLPEVVYMLENIFFKFIWLKYIYFCKNTAWKKLKNIENIKEQSMWMQ